MLFLRLPDGILEYGVELRRALAKVVRGQRPDVALTINFRETFGGTNLNQADHIAVGRRSSTRSATPGTAGCSPSS